MKHCPSASDHPKGETLTTCQMLYHTPAIILKQSPYKESDRLITFYTKQFGKIQLKAIGVRKIKSKLGGHLQPFSLLSIIFVKGQSLDKLIFAQLKEHFSFLLSDLTTIREGGYCLAQVNQLTKEREKDGRIFQLLQELFRVLSEVNCHPDPLLSKFFIFKLLVLLGYLPQLDFCLQCKSNIEEGSSLFFSFEEGGVICQKCVSFFLDFTSLSREVVKVLRWVSARPLSEFTKEKMGSQLTKEISYFVDTFLENVS